MLVEVLAKARSDDDSYTVAVEGAWCMYGREFVRPRTKGVSLAGNPKCQSRLRPLEMELGRSDLTAPFTVDQACQGPLKQHKWGLVSLCQSMHNT